jgi:hypothetical protein
MTCKVDYLFSISWSEVMTYWINDLGMRLIKINKKEGKRIEFFTE